MARDGMLCMAELDHPYHGDGMWLRGNLHAHSTESDGVRSPGDVVADYAARGYDFLAISDHDTFTDPADLDHQGSLVTIPAVEVSDAGPHTLHLGATGAVTPSEDRQSVVQAILDDSGLAVPAHPNWQESYAHWPQEELERIHGYQGIEVYNGLIEHHPGAARATDRWDRLLSTGRRVWGFANDDSHRPWEVARGWNVVRSADLTAEAILASMESGNFYASTGVFVEEIDVSDGTMSVETTNADQIRLISDFGLVQQTATGPTATFRVPDQLVHGSAHSYVRVECVGRGTNMAWLQPMFLDNRSE